MCHWFNTTQNENRYLRVKLAAERYSIIQLGVTLFVPNESESKIDTNNDCDKDLEMTENTYEDAKEEPVQEKSSQSFTTVSFCHGCMKYLNFYQISHSM